MGQPEIPKIAELKEELELWRVYREIHLKKNFDVAKFLSDLAVNTEDSFDSFFRLQFRELCKAGCVAEGLAVVLRILRYSPDLQRAWTELVGHAETRERKAMALEKAAKTLDFVYGNLLPPGDLVELGQSLGLGGVPLSQMSSALRKHANFVRLAEELSKETETRSLLEFSKYLLTSYVRRMTGEFHDRCVSALIGDLVGPKDYSELAHSQWRFRNYGRLDGYHSPSVKFFVALSVVVAHTR